MPTAFAPSVPHTARRVLRTTANAWRLKAPARRQVRTHTSTLARADVEGGVGRCPVRFGSPLAGHSLTFSY